MDRIPVIAIFDAGKTNKKLLLLDESYHVVTEHTIRLDETTDEDGFPCEDAKKLSAWVLDGMKKILVEKSYDVRAVNFSGYGATLVNTDRELSPMLPICNYLKPFPEGISEKLFEEQGGARRFSNTTASPILGNLNTGLQLYSLKQLHPEKFDRIHFSLHLPQYLSSLVTKQACSELTSLGCHTTLWNFEKNRYHDWVLKEGVDKKLPPVVRTNSVFDVSMEGEQVKVGPGIHDSSAALQPYVKTESQPFVLISTGTWCISMNPFNHVPLSTNELAMDCLCYLSPEGAPVKASRLHAGHFFEKEAARIAAVFNLKHDFYRHIDANLPARSVEEAIHAIASSPRDINFTFDKEDLSRYSSAKTAWFHLLTDIVRCQYHSTSLVIQNNTKKIFIDGGFADNKRFIEMLSLLFPGCQVKAATVPQASAIGAAIVIHEHWNVQAVPETLVRVL